MKIDQILNENTEQLDELSWQGVKTGAANTLGAIGKGIGGIASVPQGIARAVKAGYKGGVEAIGGPEDGTGAQSAPATANTQSAPATANTQSAGIESQIKQKEQELADLKTQLKQANQPAPSASAPAAKTNSAPQQTSTQTTDTKQPGVAKQYGDAVGGTAKDAGNKVAGLFKGAQDAMRAGVGMGAAGQSLMSPKAGDDVQKVKDAQGKEHQYKKVGQQWVNMADNTPVDPATAAMLDRQQKQKTAATAANAEMDKNAQAQQQPAQQQAQAQGAAGDFGFNTETGEKYNSAAEHDAGEAANEKARAAEKAANPDKFDTQTGKPLETPAADQAAQAQQNPAVWKNNRAPEGTPASTSPQAAAATAQPQGKDVQARMANQLGAAPAGIPAKDGQPAATPNFGQQSTGYGKTTYNVPTGGVPQQPAIQPTTGAKAVPQEPAAPAQTASAQDDQNKPGFLQSKLKGQQPALAEMDFSAILAKRANIRL
jgi:hypothetical protein